jgi:hypothetical protein
MNSRQWIILPIGATLTLLDLYSREIVISIFRYFRRRRQSDGSTTEVVDKAKKILKRAGRNNPPVAGDEI